MWADGSGRGRQQPTPCYLDGEQGDLRGSRGIGIRPWVGTEQQDRLPDREPEVVPACAGDTPTLETLAVVALLRQRLPIWVPGGQRRRHDAPSAGCQLSARAVEP